MRKLASRRLPYLAIILVILTGLLTIPSSTASAEPGPDECSAIKGPAKEYCLKGTVEAGDMKCADIREKKWRDQCRSEDWEVGDGGSDDVDGDDGGLLPECKEAPTPQNPGSGIVGWINDGPKQAPKPIDPKKPEARERLYEQYGMAGLKWHNYDLGCGNSFTSPGASFDTWAGDMVFSWSLWWTTLSAQAQEAATGDGFVSRLNPAVSKAVGRVNSAIFSPWIAISVILLGVVLIIRARKKDMAATVSALGWAALVMGVATFAIGYPIQALQATDKVVTSTIGEIQQSIAGSDSDEDSHPAVSQGNLMTSEILFNQWLRGTFGCDTCPVAKKYGMQLYDAQAMTWAESRLPLKERKEVVQEKRKAWTDIAAKVEQEDPDAYGHLTGKNGGRLSTAFLTGLSVLPNNLFGLAVAAVIICALFILRLMVVFFPAIAPIGLHRETSGVVKTAFKSAGAALVNAPLFALAGSLSILFTGALLTTSRVGTSPLPQWLAILLIYILTAMLWAMARPFRSMSSMVSPNRNWASDGTSTLSKGKSALAGATVGAATGYVKGRMNARQIGKILGNNKKGKDGNSPDEPDNAPDPENPSAPEEATPGTGGGTSTQGGFGRDDEDNSAPPPGGDNHPDLFVPPQREDDDPEVTLTRVPQPATGDPSTPENPSIHVPGQPSVRSTPDRPSLPPAPPGSAPSPDGDGPYRGGGPGPENPSTPGPTVTQTPATPQDPVVPTYTIYRPSTGYTNYRDDNGGSGRSTPEDD